LGFEIGLAPVLGRRQAKRHRSVDRLARAADHLLYGWSIGDAPREASDPRSPRQRAPVQV
jgi:hypothetical protein